MNYNKNFASMQVSARHLLAVGAVAGAFALALPALASASTYAYVDQSGFVRTVESNDPYAALAVAPNIDEHSVSYF